MSAAASALAAAIAQNESPDGLGYPGSNNPGNLELGDLGFGTLTTENGNEITVYPNPQAGAQALLSQSQAMITGQGTSVYNPSMTIGQAASIYTGGNANAAANWSNNLGVSPNATLGSLAGGNTSSTNLGPFQNVPNVPGMIQSGGAWILDKVTGGSGGTTTLLDPERIIALIIGLLLVAAGLFSFKQTQTIIQTVGKHAAKGAELLA